MERNNTLTANARALRKQMTKEEVKLWYQFLRLYRPRFHRQYVIGNYIADFYCNQAKLVVELDGSQHCNPEEHRIRSKTNRISAIARLNCYAIEQFGCDAAISKCLPSH